MIKRLLLGVTMLASLGSVSAQEAVVLNPQQVENVSSLMEKSANLKVGDMGFAGASQHPLGIAQMPSHLRSMKKPAPMRRAGEDNTIWFAYPMSEDGKFSAIGWKIISVIYGARQLCQGRGRFSHNGIGCRQVHKRKAVDRRC